MRNLKETNKYYTPTIEEFHVGFEYEKQGVDGSWSKEILEVDELKDIKEEMLPITRVKYIDLEDLYSLGYTLLKEAPTFKKYIKGKFITGHYGIGSVIVWDEVGELFDGTIKNKSELKKLFTQLNIK